MTCQDNEILLNNVLIQMARSFLQYVAESSPWVSAGCASVEKQFIVLAERQRQSVSKIVDLLTSREHYIDFGSFPTEYTDQQFLSLQALMKGLRNSQELVCSKLKNGAESLRAAGDTEGGDLLSQLEILESDTLHALDELSAELLKREPVVR